MTEAEKTVVKTQAEIDADIDKARAEAEQARAEAKKAEQEALKCAAQTRREVAFAVTAECDQYESEVAMERQKELRARELASDCQNHVYRFVGEVNDAQVSSCMKELSYWHRTEEKCPITVIFYSPGGSVIAGMALFDFLSDLKRSGHHLTTVCSGYAASMAGILLQAGSRRVIGPESYILIHEITAGTHGKIGEMKDDVKFYERICNRVIDIFVTRSGGKLKKSRMEKEWRGHDWWIDSDLALALGIVDEVQ